MKRFSVLFKRIRFAVFLVFFLERIVHNGFRKLDPLAVLKKIKKGLNEMKLFT